MNKLTSMQQKSFAAAVVLVFGVGLSAASGKAFIPSDVLTDQVLGSGHIQIEAPKTIVPTNSFATLGLRHPVSTDLEEVLVTRVVDGDSLDVAFSDGTVSRVRLIGINTPEYGQGADEVTEEGRLATTHMISIVLPGTMVYLQKDTTEKDAEGQLLRYVWLARPLNFSDPTEIKAKMVNGKMLIDGYAVAHKFKPNDAYFTLFKTMQLDAFHANRGLWKNGMHWSNSV